MGDTIDASVQRKEMVELADMMDASVENKEVAELGNADSAGVLDSKMQSLILKSRKSFKVVLDEIKLAKAANNGTIPETSLDTSYRNKWASLRNKVTDRLNENKIGVKIKGLIETARAKNHRPSLPKPSDFPA